MKLYACGVDYQHEIGHASDLEGNMPLYSSVKALKRTRKCWEECGIVELELSLSKWVEPQDLFGKLKKKEKIMSEQETKTPAAELPAPPTLEATASDATEPVACDGCDGCDGCDAPWTKASE